MRTDSTGLPSVGFICKAGGDMKREAPSDRSTAATVVEGPAETPSLSSSGRPISPLLLPAIRTAPAAPLALAPDGPGPKAAMALAARPESWKPPVVARAAPAGLAAL
jgi:hypothetical protein